MSVFLDNFEWAWGTWALLCAFLTWVTIRAFKRLRIPLISHLIRREDGAAYTLSYVMTVPLYLLMVVFFIELSMMLVAKIGTVYSAYGAARSSIVWSTAASEGEAADKAHQSAIQTMTPFASGLTQLRLDSAISSTADSERESSFMEAYDHFSRGGSRSSRRYVGAKYRYSARATEATIQIEPRGGEPWNEDVVATVAYDYPYIFPILGRILMKPKKDGHFIQRISTTVRLQNEPPKNTEKRLGISYASP